jgi:hypothetical protein
VTALWAVFVGVSNVAVGCVVVVAAATVCHLVGIACYGREAAAPLGRRLNVVVEYMAPLVAALYAARSVVGLITGWEPTGGLVLDVAAVLAWACVWSQTRGGGRWKCRRRAALAWVTGGGR